jgi:hypothetical protein
MPKAKTTRKKKRSQGARVKNMANAFTPLLEPMGPTISNPTLEAKRWLVFEKPKQRTYKTPGGGSITRYYVEVYTENREMLLGYLPLPKPYHNAWVNLCYNVVFFWNVYLILLHTNDAVHAKPITDRRECYAFTLGESLESTSAKIRYYVHVRKILVEELLSCKGRDWALPKFDEYIIKERFDYHARSTEELRESEYADCDPFDADMAEIMSELL